MRVNGETYQVRYLMSAFTICSSINVQIEKKSGDTGEQAVGILFKYPVPYPHLHLKRSLFEETSRSRSRINESIPVDRPKPWSFHCCAPRARGSTARPFP